MPFTDAQKTEITELKQFFVAYFSVVTKKSKQLQALMGSGSNDIVIAGGAFAVMLRNCAIIDKYPKMPLKDIPDEFEKLNDIDVFLLNASFRNGAIGYSWGKFFYENSRSARVRRKGNDNGYIKNPHVLDIYEENVVVNPDKNKTVKVQYILTDYKTREELIGGFDFKHCTMNYYDKKLYVTEAAYDAAKNKKLIVNGNTEPAQWRIDKFKNSGYKEVVASNEYREAIKKSMRMAIFEEGVSLKSFDKVFGTAIGWDNPLAKLPE